MIQDKVPLHKNIEAKVGYEVTEIVGDRSVEGIRVREKETGTESLLDVKGVFVEVGLRPNTDFVKDLVDLNQYGEVKVNCRCETDVPGVFAAGDATDVHEKQIVVAAGEGAKAALSAHEFLLRGGGVIQGDRGTW